MPDVVAALVEEPDPQAPLGAKGVGEPPCIAATPAIVAAIRDAIGKDLHRVPVRPAGHRRPVRFDVVAEEREIMTWDCSASGRATWRRRSPTTVTSRT